MPPRSFEESWTAPAKNRCYRYIWNCKSRRITEPNGSSNRMKIITGRVQCSVRIDLGYPHLLQGNNCLLSQYNVHIFGTNNKLQKACYNKFIAVITNQDVIFIFQVPGSLQIYNIHDCKIGIGSFTTK